MTAGILDGIRVLDFTRVLAGPYATRLLGDFGAQVIKVQSRKIATGAEDNQQAYFSTWNRNKLSICLDMSQLQARQLALDLVSISDLVVENFSPRVMDNWGLGYDSLRAVKHDIILVRMSAMGQSGPWKDGVALAPTMQSLSGHTFLNADGNAEPVGVGFSYSDTIAGLYAALASLAALEYRKATGQGQWIDLSQYEAACTLIGPTLMACAQHQGGDFLSGDRTAPLPVAPHGCYSCRGQDRWCAIAVFDQTQWQGLVAAMGQPLWAHEARFATLADRCHHRTALDEQVAQWTRQHLAEEIVARLQAVKVPAGVVQSAEDLANDPHLSARGFFRSINHPIHGRVFTDRCPIRLMGEDQGPWQPAPLLGEHNSYVYRELLGLSVDQLDHYIQEGIIA